MLDRLPGREAFFRVVEGALHLRKLGERFAVAFIATRLNYVHLRKTLELAVALGVEGTMYNRMERPGIRAGIPGSVGLLLCRRLRPSGDRSRGPLAAIT